MDKNYKKILKKDIIIALVIKVLLMGSLIAGMKYMKREVAVDKTRSPFLKGD